MVNENQDMQGDLDQEAWERSHIEAALSEADTGDFLPEKEMAAKFNQLGQRKNAEADRWKLENHDGCLSETARASSKNTFD